MEAKDKLVLTPAEVAKMTGISINTIQDWCRNRTNDFPSFKVGRDRKIPLDSLKEWIVTQGKIGSEL